MAAIAALAVAALMAWLFSLESTLGLLEWHPPWRRNFILIGASGILPLVPALLGLYRRGDGSRKRGAVLAAASIALSGMAIALSASLAFYVYSSSRPAARPIPAFSALDPARGVPGRDGVVRLSLSSDPHWGAETSNPEARRAILRSFAAASPRRDAFMILGDNVETGMVESYWREEAADLAILGDRPVLSILGNHDGVIGGQAHFIRYFFGRGVDTDSGSPFYYSMDAGPARIVVLDLLWGAESFGPAQAAWLERTLSGLPAGRQAIVLSHSFIYASGYDDEFGLGYYDNPGSIARVAPILERHGVALVVSGHDHEMELLRKNGVTYAVIGTMGGLLDPPPTYRSPASLWLKAGAFGRLDLDISAKGIALAFRDEAGASLREEFIPAAR